MWALKMRQSGAMMNPFEYRDLMNAAYLFSDETPDQVTARYKSKSPRGGKPGKPGVPTATASKAEMAKFKDMLAKAKPRPKPATG